MKLILCAIFAAFVAVSVATYNWPMLFAHLAAFFLGYKVFAPLADRFSDWRRGR